VLERGRGRPRYSRSTTPRTKTVRGGSGPGGRRYIGLLCSTQSLFFLFVDGAFGVGEDFTPGCLNADGDVRVTAGREAGATSGARNC